MLPQQEILNLLGTMGVELPRKTKLPHAELDKRLSKALDSAQYITRVLPDPSLDPTAYPSWLDDKSNKPVIEAIRRHNVGEATLIAESHEKGINDPFPLFANAFMDLRQSLMSIANACDTSMSPVVLQDEADSSGICIRLVDVRKFDAETPIVILLYNHDEHSVSRASVDWLRSVMSSRKPTIKITATLQEQQLLLRLLKQNSKRIAQTYKPKRAAAESAFTLSFLLPVGPLPANDLAKYNTNNGCTVCGDPAKSKCARCGAVRYCDAVCQRDDWKSHKPLCNSWQGAKWQRLTFILLGQYEPGAYAFRVSRHDIVQHGDMQKRVSTPKELESQGSPENTHGAAPFIVKVQVSSSDAKGPAYQLMEKQTGTDGVNILIYDQRRSLDVMVLRDRSDAADYNAVVDVVKRKGERGIKAFCWAIRTGEWTIDICFDRLPEWQKW
ncbi:hypothetical protein GGX14DRAFT_417564 [Mycena pura]|uniref:MYND-type domain-containing protein n=1 Tax=Mycena pura TaxID=153505 RepID=A0AAD6YR08_9AGAR|nr:hypothetical protein GGX14DRAFT_417564 [Mycena pura]